jgi:hypothetical protein
MEVIHHEQSDTHVVMGGKKVRSFGISNNSTFITMLSEGLYSDKELAVVREVMCNGWDIHINTKREATPMKVTVDEKKMVFRDYGTGIHDNMMEQVYCIYGNSTKAHNGEENGGFGLGSKAPFAYSTHFTVTSFHEGVKTVYGISRGSLETENKPDIRTMVSVPTTETGLEVSIPLKTPRDSHQFVQLIRAIAFLGQMNVEVNGIIADKLDADFDKNHVKMLTQNEDNIRRLQMREDMYIRYGTVVYPLVSHEEYQDEYDQLRRILPNRNYSDSKCFIIQAQPNTIAVTPTRETLSYTNQTKASIKGLLQKAIDGFNAVAPEAYKALVNGIISEYSDLQMPDDDLFEMIGRSEPVGDSGTIRSYLDALSSSPVDIMQNYLYYNKKYKEISHASYQSVEERNKIHKDAIYKFFPNHKVFWDMLFADEITLRSKRDCILCWNWKMYYDLEGAIGPDNMKFLHRFSGGYHNTFDPMQTPDQIKKEFMNHVLNFTQFEVGFSQKAISENSGRYENKSDFCFIPNRKKDVGADLVSKLRFVGLDVKDHLQYTTYVPKDPNAKKRPKGYTLLTEVVRGGDYCQGNLGNYDLKRSETAPAIFNEATYSHERIIDSLRGIDLKHVTQLVPDAVIVSSPTTAQNAIEKSNGTMRSGQEVLWERIANLYVKYPVLAEHFAYKELSGSIMFDRLQRIAEFDPVIAAYIGSKFPDDKDYNAALYLICHFVNRYSMDIPHSAALFLREFKRDSGKAASDNQVIKKVSGNILLGSLDLSKIYTAVRNQSEQCDDMLAMLHLTL